MIAPRDLPSARVLAWFLDVDGVLVDPGHTGPATADILDRLLRLIARGDVVVLNTGREADWVLHKIVQPLWQRVRAERTGPLSSGALSAALAAVCEKGATLVTIAATEGVELDVRVVGEPALELSPAIQRTAQELLAEVGGAGLPFEQSLAVLPGKRHILTVQLRDPLLPSFREMAPLLADFEDRLRQAVGSRFGGEASVWRVERDDISVDVHRAELDKARGASRGFGWLRQMGHRPDGYVAVGDGAGDVKMATWLCDQASADICFTFVGQEDKADAVTALASGRVDVDYAVRRYGPYTRATAAVIDAALTQGRGR